MIGWLRGEVRARDPGGTVVIDAGGVGYQLQVSLQSMAVVPELGQTCELWVHTHVREDVISLFGFGSAAERRMFLLLLSVPQVGPRLATAVLGGFPLLELVAAVSDGERSKLERIPGIGRKTAERILLDLKDKVGSIVEAPQTAESRRRAASGESRIEQAREVLVGLGWKAKEVEVALDKLADEVPPELPLDDWVRRALARLMDR